MFLKNIDVTPLRSLSCPLKRLWKSFCITFLKAFTDPLPGLSLEQRTDSPCLANPSLILLPTKKTPPSQGPVFTESSEQRTENPRVVNSVILAVNMDTEGFDLIGAFFISEGFVWNVLFLSFVASVVLKMLLLDMHLSPWLN